METTYRQKKVKIKSNSLQNAMEITCRQNRVKIKSNSIQNTMVVTLMQKKVMIKSNSLQDTMMVIGHLYAEVDKERSSWKGVEARALRNFACSF